MNSDLEGRLEGNLKLTKETREDQATMEEQLRKELSSQVYTCMYTYDVNFSLCLTPV